MADIWAANNGVYFGYACEQTEGPSPKLHSRDVLRYIGDRHLVTLGPNGSGKSMRVLLPSICELSGWSQVVVDNKGDLTIMTADLCRRQGRNVLIYDPFGITGMKSDRYNAIKGLDKSSQEFVDDAMMIIETVIKAEGHEPHWGHSAQEISSGLTMYTALEIPDGSLADVRGFLGLGNKQMKGLVERPEFDYKGRKTRGIVAAAEAHSWPEIAIKAGRLADVSGDNRELQSTLSTARTQTRSFDSRPIKAVMSEGFFDFARLKNEPMVVFLVLPAKRSATHTAWLRLMIAAIVQGLMKDTRRTKVPVMLMLDEYFALAEGDGLPVISKNMAQLRGFGVKCWFSLQDLTQIQELYPKRWESFLGNAGVIQSFAPQELTTADYLSRRTFEKTVAAVSGSDSISRGAGGGSGSSSTSYGQVKVPVMTAQTISSMDDGYSILFSHKTKGTVRTYFPFPTELSHLREVMAKAP